MAEQMTPPGNFAAVASPDFQAPAHYAGGFSLYEATQGSDEIRRASRRQWELLGGVPGVIVPVTPDLQPMSPIDKKTGVVLPIVTEIQKGWKDRHHAHFFKRSFAEGSLGQKANRASRLQLMPRRPHDVLHQRIMGTAFADSEQDEFCITVLNCAGYIPQSALYISAENKFKLITLSSRQREALRQPKVLTIEKEKHAQMRIGQFLMNYALSQKVSDRALKQVREFISITPEMMAESDELREKKERLGMRITNIAIGQSVTPVVKTFEIAKRHRALRLGTPPTAWGVVKERLQQREPEYFGTLEEALCEQYGIAA